MNSGRRITGGILLLAALFACERTFDLGLDTPKPRLAVVGTFSPEEALRVEVTATRSALGDASTTYPLDARVELYEGATFLRRLELTPPTDGQTPFFSARGFVPKPGTEYRLRVQARGYETVEARSTAPASISLGFAEGRLVERKATEDPAFVECSYEFRIGFSDPPQKQFYHAHLYLLAATEMGSNGNTSGSESEIRRIVFGHAMNTNYQIAHYDGGLLLDDTPFNGRYHTLTLPVTLRLNKDARLPATLIAELRTTSPEYYQFFSAVNRQRNSLSLPFAEPVILFSNVQNGAGVFAGYSAAFLGAEIKD